MEILRPNSIISNAGGWTGTSGSGLISDITGSGDIRNDADTTELGHGDGEIVLKFDNPVSGENVTRVKIFVYTYSGDNDINVEFSFNSGSTWTSSDFLSIGATGQGWKGTFVDAGSGLTPTQITNMRVRITSAGFASISEAYIQLIHDDEITLLPATDVENTDWTSDLFDDTALHLQVDDADPMPSIKHLLDPDDYIQNSYVDSSFILSWTIEDFDINVGYIDVCALIQANGLVSVEISLDGSFWYPSDVLDNFGHSSLPSWACTRFTGPFTHAELSSLQVRITATPATSIKIYQLQVLVPTSLNTVHENVYDTLDLEDFAVNLILDVSDTLVLTDFVLSPRVFEISLTSTLSFGGSGNNAGPKLRSTSTPLVFSDHVTSTQYPTRLTITSGLVFTDNDHPSLFKSTLHDILIVNDAVRPNRYEPHLNDILELLDFEFDQLNSQFLDDFLLITDFTNQRYSIFNGDINEEYLTLFEEVIIDLGIYNAFFNDTLVLTDKGQRTFPVALVDTLVLVELLERIKYADSLSELILVDLVNEDLRHGVSNQLTLHDKLCLFFKGTIHLGHTLVFTEHVARVIPAPGTGTGPTSFTITYRKNIYDHLAFQQTVRISGIATDECSPLLVSGLDWMTFTEGEWLTFTEAEWAVFVEEGSEAIVISGWLTFTESDWSVFDEPDWVELTET